jgi:hypothetical protein
VGLKLVKSLMPVNMTESDIGEPLMPEDAWWYDRLESGREHPFGARKFRPFNPNVSSENCWGVVWDTFAEQTFKPFLNTLPHQPLDPVFVQASFFVNGNEGPTGQIRQANHLQFPFSSRQRNDIWAADESDAGDAYYIENVKG